MESTKSNINNGYQNIFVMRHGDRADHFDPLWVSNNPTRPWDPPLAHEGKVRAFGIGKRIRSQNGFPIHRVFVSPFLRCIQTASEVIAALYAVDFDPKAMSSSKDVSSIDKSKLKVAIEFGLCEILNKVAIKSEVAPKDWKFDFKISDLEAMFPDGMVDPNVDMVYKEMPQWEESLEDARNRYVNTMKALAEKYPSENLLLVTHWGGVSAPLYKFFTQTKYVAEYCGSVELRREVSSKDESVDSVELEDGVEVFFSIKKSTQLKRLMYAYCDRRGLELDAFAFMFDGHRIRCEQTPDELDIKDGDEIHALRSLGGGLRAD